MSSNLKTHNNHNRADVKDENDGNTNNQHATSTSTQASTSISQLFSCHRCRPQSHSSSPLESHKAEDDSRVKIMDKNISFATLHLPLPFYLRLDVLPFVVLYSIILSLALPALLWEYEANNLYVAESLEASIVPESLAAILVNQTVDDELFTAVASTSTSTHSDSFFINSSDEYDALTQSSNSTATFHQISAAMQLLNANAPALYHFIAMYFIPVFILIHALTFLSAYWSKAFAVRIRYSKCSSSKRDADLATHIYIQPNLHCGASQICALETVFIDQRSTRTFTFQKTRYVLHRSSSLAHKYEYYAPIEYPICLPLQHYFNSRGLITSAESTATLNKYGSNVFDIPLPSFFDLFSEHAVAPFFLFQIFCVLLWCLDEYWYYSLMTLFMLVSFEATVVTRRLNHLKFVRDMRVPAYQVHVYRHLTWSQCSSADLLPNDLVWMTRSQGDAVCPCDMLLLRGTAVVNESLLTGESVPQIKEAIDADTDGQEESSQQLNIQKLHRRHVLFGGTKLLITHSEASSIGPASACKLVPNCQDKDAKDGALCYVLKTGFHSSQGKLVRTILYSTDRVSVNNTESLLFILFLLIFALIASAYVLMKGLEDENRSRYKLMLNCIMIITSVVPPELPMELSLAVNTSLIELARYQIFCTEPFRIPLAGALSICCFDKTGTLTADLFYVEGIAGIANNNSSSSSPVHNNNSTSTSHSAHVPLKIEEKKEDRVTSASLTSSSKSSSSSASASIVTSISTSNSDLLAASSAPLDVKLVIAGCHSLTLIDNLVVGDPLEKSALSAIQWKCSNQDEVVAADSSASVKILHRYAFSSQLKRMSCIIAIDHNNKSKMSSSSSIPLRLVTKGAAEVMYSMFDSKTLPANYTLIYSQYSRQGSRVLALGYRLLPSAFKSSLDKSKWKEFKRGDLEQDLIFAGFLILSCPIKPDSKSSVEHLIDSSHHVVMITGDNALTACSVAQQLTLVTRACAILTYRAEEEDLVWLDTESKMIQDYPFYRHNSKQKHQKQQKDVQDATTSISSAALSSSSPFTHQQHLQQLLVHYELCVTGDALEVLQATKSSPTSTAPSIEELNALLFQSRVFARTSPDQKEYILLSLKSSGRICLMCGDGTNDVGALKQAHVGVALIGDDGMSEEAQAKKLKKQEEKKEREAKLLAANAKNGGKPGSKWSMMFNLSKQIQTEMTELEQRHGRAFSSVEKTTFMKQRMEEEMKKWSADLGVEEQQAVRLGDASIASPFTSKTPFISSVLHIIRQGRCTLVTTLQMFEILGINCLISAYSMSVLYLDGVKMGDTQMTIAGLSIAAFFLLISRSKPLDRLSSQRPPSKLFTWHMMTSILGQFALHMFVLYSAVALSRPHTPTDRETRSPETKFTPNVLNTVVYLCSQIATTATFAANYRGHPFMQSMRENTALFYAIAGSASFMFLLASGISLELNTLMQLVEMPDYWVRFQLVALLLFDLSSTILYSALLQKIFEIKLSHEEVELKRRRMQDLQRKDKLD